MDDDFDFPGTLDPDSDPTAQGIVQCLKMLVEEASTLRLSRTLAALQTAMTVCADEGETGEHFGWPSEDFRAPGMLLH